MNVRQITGYIAKTSILLATIVVSMMLVFGAQMFVKFVEMTLAEAKQATQHMPDVKKNPVELPQDKVTRINVSSKRFLPDGTLLLEYRVPYEYDDKRHGTIQIYDVNDTLFWEGKDEECQYKYIEWGTTPLRDNYEQLKGWYDLSHALSGELAVPVRSETRIEQIWRYDIFARRFVGWQVGGSVVGYLGVNGFTQSKSLTEPFGRLRFYGWHRQEDQLNGLLLWVTEKVVYKIDFMSRDMQTIFESAGPSITQIACFPDFDRWRQDKEPLDVYYKPIFVIDTEDGLNHLVLTDTKEHIIVKMPTDWAAQSFGLAGNVVATQDGIFLRYSADDANPPSGCPRHSFAYYQWEKNYRAKEHKSSVAFYRIERDGSLNLVNRFEWTVPAVPQDELDRYYNDPFDQLIFCNRPYLTSVSSPLWVLPGYFCNSWRDRDHFGQEGIFGSVLQFFVEQISPTSIVTTATVIGVFVAMTLAHAWPRRTSPVKLAFWLLFVGVFNLAGLMTYVALNHTPVIRCPVCGRKRGLAQVACVRCGGELPQPQRRATDLILAGQG